MPPLREPREGREVRGAATMVFYFTSMGKETCSESHAMAFVAHAELLGPSVLLIVLGAATTPPTTIYMGRDKYEST